MTKKRNSTSAIICMIIVALAGCKKDEPPPPPAAQPKPPVQAQVPVQKQPSSAKSAQSGTPQFDFGKMKDPFKAFVVEQPKAAAPLALRKSVDALPIESYEAGSFKVAGIIVGLKENSALVIDPAGKGYVVKQGMIMGSNHGRIVRITAAAVEIDERYVEESGRAKRRTVKLTLPQKK